MSMIKRNAKGQFLKGEMPWNKGLQMRSSQWNGGETVNNQGRIMVIIGYRKDGTAVYRQRSRIVMEKLLGRPLKRFEIVHHIDEDKSNDSVDNLMLLTSKEHNNIHKAWLGRKDGKNKENLHCRLAYT